MNIKKYQLVEIAGGRGLGLLHRTRNEIPKCLLEVEGKPLLEYSLDLYAENGLEDFILLLGHLSDKVIGYVEKSKYKGEVKYSVEKEPLGKGGAIKYALDNGTIDRDRPCIIQYPDDVILEKNFPKELIEYHEKKKEEGALATIVSVPRMRQRYGFLECDGKGFVTYYEEKPLVETVTNVAIYVLEPEVYRIIDENIDLSKKPVDFESNVLPKLCENRKLVSFFIEQEEWVPFNDEKDFENGIRKIRSLKKNLF